MEPPQLLWEVSTAYDLFISLQVLHDPSRYGLRGAWAAGVRSRLPAEEREILQQVVGGHIWFLPWLSTLPAPKSGPDALQALAEIPAAERLPVLAAYYMPADVKTVLLAVARRGTWGPQDKESLKTAYEGMDRVTGEKGPSDKELARRLEIWSQAEAYGDGLLAGLRAYYEVFFAEEEERILPVLETAVTAAQSLALRLSLRHLLEELSQGVRFTEALDMPRLIMAPSFWITPLTIFTAVNSAERKHPPFFVFGARPAEMSLVPGTAVPDLLYQTLKALADPTRLRILRYLSAEPLTPAELSRRLRLRPPTVVHHLHALRLARLVNLTLGQEGRRYEARREAVKAASAMLDEYLDKGSKSGSG